MPVITGTDGTDELHGTEDPDLIRALAGADTVFGAGGNDEIEGGEGDDILSGEEGDDLLYGGPGDDVLLEDMNGTNDRLYGEDGNDQLRYVAFAGALAHDALLDGGAGDDVLFHRSAGNANRATLIGGDGHDRLRAFGGDHVAIDAGADADLVRIVHYRTDYDIVLGAGADHMVLLSNQANSSDGVVAIADFVAGNAGDSLSLISYLAWQTSNWSFADNPFATGHLGLIQRGADAVLQFDRDGAGSAYAVGDLIVFRDVVASALTAHNLAGYDPGGGAVAGLAIDGSEATDFLGGTSGNDLVRGLGGHDGMYGGAGDDRLEGGAGDDFIEGEIGNDLLLGGDGNDTLEETLAGDDQLFGEAGDDSLLVDRQWFGQPASTAQLDGGDGNDQLFYTGRRGFDDAVLNGGAGDDHIIANVARSVVIDAGAGDDYVSVDLDVASATVTLGAGKDIVAPQPGWPVASVTVLDFEPGDAGDRFDLFSFLFGTGAYNAFSPNLHDQDLRLQQSGADTLLLFDFTGQGNDFTPIMRLAGVDASLLTLYNIGFVPMISHFGSAGADSLAGTAVADEISGFAGNDVLSGQGGADRLIGGAGSDRMEGGAGADVFTFAAGDSPFALRSDGRKFMPDMILDFASGEDRIDLSAIDAVDGTAFNDAFTFIGAAAFSGQAGELRCEIRDGVALIAGDMDGNGVAELLIVAHTPILQAADFVL